MSKNLTLIRHAKSSWDEVGLTDHARPLNKRGLKDARRMGKALNSLGLAFDMVLCSSAKRAMSTLELMREHLKVGEHHVHYLDALYGASPMELINAIQALDGEYDRVAIIGHNPGLESLADELTNAGIDRLPTCTVVQIAFGFDDWNKLGSERGEQMLYLRPKVLA